MSPDSRILGQPGAVAGAATGLSAAGAPMEGRLGLALSAARVGCWELDLASGAVERSPVVDELYGFAAGEAGAGLGTFRDRHHPGDETLGRHLFAEVVARGDRHISHEYRITLPGGEIRWLSLHGEILPGPDGGPGRLTGILMDVTDRRRAEIALEQSRERLELVVGATGLGIWDWDVASGSVVLCAHARAICGLPAEEPIMIDRIRALIHPDDREEVSKIRQDALDPDQRGPAVYEFRIVRADGETRWVSARGRTVFSGMDAGARAVRCVGSLIDVTRRRTMEAELRETARHRQLLLQELTHRVKNNLQVVAALLRLQADRIEDAGVYAGQAQAGNPTRIDFAAYLRDLCGHADGVLRSRDAPVGLELAVDPGANIELDIDRAVALGLIVNELLSNAVKHAFPGERAGYIRVGLGRNGGRLRLVIGDDGVGLPEPGRWNESRRGLGNVLARRLARQIKADIGIGGGPGTLFEIGMEIDAAGAPAKP